MGSPEMRDGALHGHDSDSDGQARAVPYDLQVVPGRGFALAEKYGKGCRVKLTMLVQAVMSLTNSRISHTIALGTTIGNRFDELGMNVYFATKW